jgi:hypothetical protein
MPSKVMQSTVAVLSLLHQLERLPLSKQRTSHFPVDAVSLEQVLFALQDLTSELFGASVRPVSHPPDEVWHSSVQCWQIGERGIVYLDLLARPQKQNQPVETQNPTLCVFLNKYKTKGYVYASVRCEQHSFFLFVSQCVCCCCRCFRHFSFVAPRDRVALSRVGPRAGGGVFAHKISAARLHPRAAGLCRDPLHAVRAAGLASCCPLARRSKAAAKRERGRRRENTNAIRENRFAAAFGKLERRAAEDRVLLASRAVRRELLLVSRVSAVCKQSVSRVSKARFVGRKELEGRIAGIWRSEGPPRSHQRVHKERPVSTRALSSLKNKIKQQIVLKSTEIRGAEMLMLVVSSLQTNIYRNNCIFV